MEHDDCTALVTLTRADIIESIHYGAFTLVDRQGNLVASQGNPETLTYPRSSMKPLQVIPFIENKGHKKFKLTLEETAIMCASHHGTDAHVAVLKSMHQKSALTYPTLNAVYTGQPIKPRQMPCAPAQKSLIPIGITAPVSIQVC